MIDPRLEGLIFFALSFVLAVVITPIVIHVAKKNNWLDLPSLRKIHQIPIPRLGGVGVFFSLWVSWGIFCFVFPNVIPMEAKRPLWGIFGGP